MDNTKTSQMTCAFVNPAQRFAKLLRTHPVKMNTVDKCSKLSQTIPAARNQNLCVQRLRNLPETYTGTLLLDHKVWHMLITATEAGPLRAVESACQEWRCCEIWLPTSRYVVFQG